MKKLSILLIGLLLVAGLAFAQDEEMAGPEVTVDGEASLTFGIDLNDPITTGFKNAASASIELDWFAGDEEVSEVAFIRLSGWEISFDSDDDDPLTVGAPSIEAGFIFEPITITIYSAPSFEGGNATGFAYLGLDEEDARDEVEVALANKNVATAAAADASTDGKVVYVETGETPPTEGIQIGATDFYFVPDTAAGAGEESTSYQGLTITVDLDVATVDLLFASDGTWENSDNDYAVGAEVSASVDPIDFNAGVYAGPFDAMDLGFTVGVGATIDPITVDIGFDGWLADAATDMNYDLSAELGLDLGVVSLSSLTYLDKVGAADMTLDQEVVLDASGAVEGLGFTETFQMVNVLDTLGWYSLTEVSYTLEGGIMPYADFGIDDASVIDLTVGVDFTELVNNTVFKVEYDVDDIANNNGAVIFKATISF